jgi:hypothetical protein
MTITHLALQRQRLIELDLLRREMKRQFNQSLSLIKPIHLKAWNTFVLRTEHVDIPILNMIESFGYKIIQIKWHGYWNAMNNFDEPYLEIYVSYRNEDDKNHEWLIQRLKRRYYKK